MNAKELEQILSKVKSGELTPDEALTAIRHLPYQDLGFAKLDHHRELRQGFGEVIYAPGKTPIQCALLVKELLLNTTGPVLLSRPDKDQSELALKENAKTEKGIVGERLIYWRPLAIQETPIEETPTPQTPTPQMSISQMSTPQTSAVQNNSKDQTSADSIEGDAGTGEAMRTGENSEIVRDIGTTENIKTAGDAGTGGATWTGEDSEIVRDIGTTENIKTAGDAGATGDVRTGQFSGPDPSPSPSNNPNPSPSNNPSSPNQIAPYQIVIVSAGTADGPVARECAETLIAHGIAPVCINDVGVAGLHRLLDQTEVLLTAELIVVVAGMEGALASVIGGITPAPVIAVPTSVGYGTSFEGITALLAMLATCATGISVVGIDNGVGAAFAALRKMRKQINP